MKFLFYQILVVGLLLLHSCSSIEKNNGKGFENVYLCNAENIDNDKWKFTEVNNHKQWFANVETQSNEKAFSGSQSIKLTPEKQYGFTTDLKGIGPDEFIKVTAWRKNNNKNGVIVIDGGKEFYNGGKHIVEEKDGWEKIHLEVFTPPTFVNGKIKIFVWNNSQDSVYFDDLEIVHSSQKRYPEFSNQKSLYLQADKADLQKLHQKRIKAFETTVLVNSDEDYSNLVLFDGDNFLNGDFRLKGDLVDHIQGQKWSFRIKLKKAFSWNNLKTFSIQNPATRGFLYEWIAHKIFENEDVLTPRYGFIPIKLNNKSLGIYAWEEHFEKQLIESQNRREGPIVRFDESLFWQRVLETGATKREWDIDFFGAAKIIPFKAGRTASDSLLNLQLVEAQKLLLQYKTREKPLEQIFDINKLAKYYALIDITQAYHGFTWHNQRFYYNPVTCLLEPIAYDGYIEGGIYRRFDEQLTGLFNPEKIASLKKEEIILFQVFEDKFFREKYLDYLAHINN